MTTTFDSPTSFNNKESTADMLKTASPLAGRILFTACATLPSAYPVITTSLQPFELWFVYAILYLVLNFSLSMFVQYLERRTQVT